MYRPALAALMFVSAAYSPAAGEPSGGGAAGVVDAIAPRATLEAVLQGPPLHALLRDQASGVYQVVGTGDSFLGYRVSGLQSDRIVLTSAAGTHFVLSLAAPASAPAPAVTAVPLGSDLALDPYADTAVDVAPDPYDAESPPPDPYAEVVPPPDPYAEVVPPPDPYAEVVPPPAPVVSAPPAPVVSAPPAPVVSAPPAPVVTAPPAPAAARQETVALGRAEFHAALADFPGRSREIVMAVEPARGIRLRDVARGSIFDRLGLRAGDLVRAVAGTPVLSVDDAARVYARVLAADSFVIELERGGAAVQLRVDLTRPPR